LISVSSEKSKGTTFEIKLPLGNVHLAKQDLTEITTTPFVLYEDEKVYTTDLETEQIATNGIEGIKKDKEYSILIIEDNEELRSFLKTN
jgi:hypothetical protein